MVWQWQRNRNHRGRNGGGELVGSPGSTGAEPQRGGSGPIESPISASPENRSSPLSDPSFLAGLRPIPSRAPGDGPGGPAVDVVGVTPEGVARSIVIEGTGGALLLAFLHTECDGCEEFWRVATDDANPRLPGPVSLAVITKGPESVAPAAVAQAARGVHRVPVVMSDQAWCDYRVLSYPFFVIIDQRSRTVSGETVGFGWSDVLSMVHSAGW